MSAEVAPIDFMMARTSIRCCKCARNEVIRNYIVQAQKMWRKHNAAMLLATQSIKELQESDMLHIVAESCPTKIFLANPEMDVDLYREAFHLLPLNSTVGNSVTAWPSATVPAGSS